VPPFTEITFTSTDGLSLYARDYAATLGAAKCPVICIHGLTRNSTDFEEVAPWLASLGRRVLAVDVRGRGRSGYDANIGHYSISQYVADVVLLAHKLGIGRAVFIGTSMGGLITMALAMKHLNLIAAAVLNDIGPVLSETGLNRIAAYSGKVISFASWNDAVDYVKTINQSAFPNNSHEEWERWAKRAFHQAHDGRWILKYDPNIAVPLRLGKLKASSWGAKFAFRRLAGKRPTLLIRGALSDLLEIEQAAYMRQVAPSMRYVEVPDVGHAPMLMEAEAATALRQFLAEVD
jgi:pimeloyl-ACP methyl ester carboxylesterase